MHPEIEILDGRSHVVGVEVTVAKVRAGKDGVHELRDIVGEGRGRLGLTDLGDGGAVRKGVDEVRAAGQAGDVELGDPIGRARHLDVDAADIGILGGVQVVGQRQRRYDGRDAELEDDHRRRRERRVPRPQNHRGGQRIAGRDAVVKAGDAAELIGQQWLRQLQAALRVRRVAGGLVNGTPAQRDEAIEFVRRRRREHFRRGHAVAGYHGREARRHGDDDDDNGGENRTLHDNEL